MPPQISLNELYQLKKKKDNIKNVCFDKIIELCHRRIRNISSQVDTINSNIIYSK